MQAFLLGAGLGTRLRPLTDHVPKPLVPLFHKPLMAWAVEACRRAGIDRFAINTHHLPQAWNGFADRVEIGTCACTFFHEPVLLDTGGGLRNIRPWLRDEPLLVHNGDIFTSLPLERLIAAHQQSGLPATLALRTHGTEKRVAWDPAKGRVLDVRHALGISPGTHVFSGVYCVNPEFLEAIPDGQVVSVIPAFLHFAAQGRLGGVVLDEGDWLDLGQRDAYLAAHQSLALAPPVDECAHIGPGAVIERSVIGPGAIVEAGAIVRDSVLWPDTRVPAHSQLDRCIVAAGTCPPGHHRHADW
jgi:mannose-1-phosphate guanylyltransferase